MPSLPLRPRLKHYSGSKPELRRKPAEHNAMNQWIVDHINTKIANDPAENQTITYGYVASHLRLTLDQVTHAVEGGGNNGIRVNVSDEDGVALARALRTIKLRRA